MAAEKTQQFYGHFQAMATQNMINQETVSDCRPYGDIS